MNTDALALTFAILAPGLLVIVAIFAMVVLDAAAAARPRPRHVGRHRAPVIDGEVLSSDTVPIPTGGVR